MLVTRVEQGATFQALRAVREEIPEVVREGEDVLLMLAHLGLPLPKTRLPVHPAAFLGQGAEEAERQSKAVVEGAEVAVLRETPEMPEIRLFLTAALVTPETPEVPVTQDRQATQLRLIACQ